jgi:hypothetical protein
MALGKGPWTHTPSWMSGPLKKGTNYFMWCTSSTPFSTCFWAASTSTPGLAGALQTRTLFPECHNWCFQYHLESGPAGYPSRLGLSIEFCYIYYWLETTLAWDLRVHRNDSFERKGLWERIAQTVEEKETFGKRIAKKDTSEKYCANMQPLRKGWPTISFGEGGSQWKLSMGSFGKGDYKERG